jgi:hypothetical protein
MSQQEEKPMPPPVGVCPMHPTMEALSAEHSREIGELQGKQEEMSKTMSLLSERIFRIMCLLVTILLAIIGSTWWSSRVAASAATPEQVRAAVVQAVDEIARERSK